jgi:hypothetical protein
LVPLAPAELPTVPATALPPAPTVPAAPPAPEGFPPLPPAHPTVDEKSPTPTRTALVALIFAARGSRPRAGTDIFMLLA